MSFTHLLRRAPVLPLCIVLPVWMVAMSAGGCGDDGPAAEPTGPTGTTTGSGGSDVGGGGAGAGSVTDGQTGREVFEMYVLDDIMEECGACHQLQGAADSPFLAAPDIYVSISSWPGFILPDWQNSALLSHPADPQHGAGQAPDLSEELRGNVELWLEKEANDLPEPETELTSVTPFKPLLNGAFNTVYLDELGPQFTNVSVTFNAAELGDPPSMLLLENLEVHPISEMTLSISHPLFSAYPQEGGVWPDPSDSLSNVEAEFSLDTSSQLGTGTVILTAWEKDAFLGLAFEDIQATGGAVSFIPCDDVDAFKSNAVPAMQVCADTCHGGEDPDAQDTMDLSGIDDSFPEEACGQVRARITPGDPDASQIVVVTDPGQPVVHKFKFMGVTANHQSFKEAVTPWIMAEQ